MSVHAYTIRPGREPMSPSMPAHPSSSRSPSPLSLLPRPWRFAQRAAQALATLVGAAWICFGAAVLANEGWRSFWPAMTIMAPLAAIVLTAWMWPRAAGPVLLGAAGLAAWRLPHPAPQVMMALPFGVAGLTLLACFWRTLVRSR